MNLELKRAIVLLVAVAIGLALIVGPLVAWYWVAVWTHGSAQPAVLVGWALERALGPAAACWRVVWVQS